MKIPSIHKIIILISSPLLVSACMQTEMSDEVAIESSPFSSYEYTEFVEDLEALGYQSQETFDATEELLGFQVDGETFTNAETEEFIDIIIHEDEVIALYGYLQGISQFVDPQDYNHAGSGTNLSTVVNENHDIIQQFLAEDLFYNEEQDKAVSMNFLEDDYEYRLLFLNEESKPVLEEITNLILIETE